MTREQAWALVVTVCERFNGLTIADAQNLKQALILLDGIINPKDETPKKET